MTDWIYDDGGREAAGFKGKKVGDCVARAVSIASGRPYAEVYAVLAKGNRTQRVTKHSAKKGTRAESAAHGIWTQRKWFKDYMAALGFKWTPTMQIGSGTKVHLTASELPKGRLVISVSRHYTTMIDGVIHDTFDPRRPMVETTPANPTPRHIETRAVYGYWSFEP